MADLLLHNARIWTGDPAAPWATAALIRHGRFDQVGAAGGIEAPHNVETLDAHGRLVVPGLTDGHAHLLGTGAAMRSVDLKRTASAIDAASRVATRAASTAEGEWIRGAGWDQNDWSGAAFPHRRDLDALVPERPVYLVHTSGHCAWANSAALRIANVTAATRAPTGGAIDLDADGEPTGVLRDAAMRLIADAIPALTQSDRIDAMRDAVTQAHRLGLTGAHAMDVGRGELQALYALNDAGDLRLRVRTFLSATRIDEWVDRNLTTGDGDEMLRCGGVKFFADGALGSLTAWMQAPYEGTNDAGFPLQPIDELRAQVARSLEHGLAPAIHAIGDRANHEVLDLLEALRGVAPHLPRRIEHAQLLRHDDIVRFGALGVTASAQPIHATQDMAKVDRSWGARGAGAYVFASLLASGANLAFGSDTPVESMDPIAGIHAAVARRNAAGEPAAGWYPDERIALDAALVAYTAGCARATGETQALGRIAPGYHADFVVLTRDLFALDDPMDTLDCARRGDRRRRRNRIHCLTASGVPNMLMLWNRLPSAARR